MVFGHSKQLWGLAINHMDGSVATAGYDKHIVKWRETQLEWRVQVGYRGMPGNELRGNACWGISGLSGEGSKKGIGKIGGVEGGAREGKDVRKSALAGLRRISEYRKGRKCGERAQGGDVV